MKSPNLFQFANPTMLILYVFAGFFGYHIIPEILRKVYPISNWWGAIIGIIILALGMRGFFHYIIGFIFDIPGKFINVFKKRDY